MNKPLQSLLMLSVRGGGIMCNDMHVALRQIMDLWSPSSNHIWFGYFSHLKVILGAKVINTTGDVIYLNVYGWESRRDRQRDRVYLSSLISPSSGVGIGQGLSRFGGFGAFRMD